MPEEPKRDIDVHDRRFAASTKRLREEKGWSQNELARKMVDKGFEGFHQTTISRIEKLERPVRISESIGLASVLGSRVTMMIAPPEKVTLVEEFQKNLVETEAARREIAVAAEKYLSAHLGLDYSLTVLDESGGIEWAEEGLKKDLESLVNRAKHILSMSPQKVLTESIEDWLGPTRTNEDESDEE